MLGVLALTGVVIGPPNSNSRSRSGRRGLYLLRVTSSSWLRSRVLYVPLVTDSFWLRSGLRGLYVPLVAERSWLRSGRRGLYVLLVTGEVHTCVDIEPKEPTNMACLLAFDRTQASPQSLCLNDPVFQFQNM